MSSVDGARSLQMASDETFTNACAPCNHRGVQREATHYCNDCQELLCGNCTDAHKGMRVTRNHKIVSVKNLPKQVATSPGLSCIVLCDCSQNFGVTEYCEDHDDVLCQTCKTIKHRRCKTTPTDVKSTNYTTKNFALIAQKAKTMTKEINAFLKDKNMDQRKIATMKEKCKEDIKSFRKQLNAFLDLLEQDSLKELETLEAMERKEIDHQVSTLSTTKQMLQADDNLLEDAKKSSEKRDMFSADVKVSKHLNDYETLLQDIRQETKSPIMTFRENDELIGMKTKIKRLGTLTVDHKQDHKSENKLFLNLKIDTASQIDVKLQDDKETPFITACVVMPDDQVLLCDQFNNRVKLLSKSFTIKDTLDLKCELWDASGINSSSAIITLPCSQQLQYIDVVPRLKTGRVIKLDKKCFGVEVAGGEIYVICHNNSGAGEVRCLDMNGNMKRRIGVKQDGSCMFTMSYYLTVSSSSGKIFVSDCGTDTVTCLMSDGSVVYQYNDPDLRRPSGVCVDDDDNIIVCGIRSHNVQVVTAAGKKHQTLLTSNDGTNTPMSVAYRRSDGTLIVGCYNQSKLFTYKLAA